MWGKNPSFLWEKCPSYEIPIYVCHQAGGGVFGDSISLSLLPILMCFFYLLFWGRCSASSQILFRGNLSICSYIFIVFMGGGKLRLFLSHHLKPPPNCASECANMTQKQEKQSKEGFKPWILVCYSSMCRSLGELMLKSI